MFISQHCLPLVSWFYGLVDFEVLCLVQRHEIGQAGTDVPTGPFLVSL